MIEHVYDDGGRAEAGFKGEAGDCGVRAAAIATGLPYETVYHEINRLAKDERPRGGKKWSSAREGVWPKTLGKFLEPLGFDWAATMQIGSGCRVHLSESERRAA